MVSSGANVIAWCYHVMLSSGMITPPFLFFLETSLTRKNGQDLKNHINTFCFRLNNAAYHYAAVFEVK
jgi:hypothetical protein